MGLGKGVGDVVLVGMMSVLTLVSYPNPPGPGARDKSETSEIKTNNQ